MSTIWPPAPYSGLSPVGEKNQDVECLSVDTPLQRAQLLCSDLELLFADLARLPAPQSQRKRRQKPELASVASDGQVAQYLQDVQQDLKLRLPFRKK